MVRPQRTIEKLQRGGKVVIAALGDSLTQGWMVRRGYIDFLKEMLKGRYPASDLTIVRKGIPGDTADNGLYRLRYDILEYNPDCVLIQYAINDAFMGYTSRQFRSTIQEIIEEIQADGDADIVLVTSSYIGDNADAEIIDEFHRQLEEIGTLVQYDMVHPTEDGYRFMAEALVALF